MDSAHNVDGLYQSIRPLGQWQCLQVLFICLANVQISFHLFSIVFIGYEPTFTCVLDNATDIWSNLTTVTSDQCSVINGSNANVSTPCTHWQHTGEDKTTITAELKLVCADRYKVQLAQTLLIAGQAVGASLFSMLSDRYGRKFILIIAEVALLIVTFVTAFVPYAWMFLVLRFMTGVAQQGLVMPSTVLKIEQVKTEYRALIGNIVMAAFSVSGCLLALLGYFFQDESWRHFQLLLSLSGLVVIVIHIMTANSFVYFSNSLLSTSLGGNRYLNFFLTCVVEVPALATGYICLKWIGRKKTLIIWQIVIALTSLTSSLIWLTSDIPFWIPNLIWFTSKFCVILTFGSLFIYTPELYPTKLRNIGLGIGSSSSRVGGMIAPFMVYVLDIAKWMPGPIFCGVALLSSLFVLPLTETVHAELPQNIVQMEEICSKKKTRRSVGPI